MRIKPKKYRFWKFPYTYIELGDKRIQIKGTVYWAMLEDGSEILSFDVEGVSAKGTTKDLPTGGEIADLASDPTSDLHEFLRIKFSDQIWAAQESPS